MRLFAYDDRKKWGRWLCEAIRDRGGQASVFKKARKVPDTDGTIVYMPLNHRPKYLLKGKRAAEEIAKKKNVLTIPGIDECRLYDNKILQSKSFQDWMPRTHVITSECEARTILQSLSYPFVSKASQGAGSSNVRMIEDEKHAENEIRSAFSSSGITCHYNLRQKGYLLWQEFVPGNEFDWRVAVLGRSRRCVKAVKRLNKPGTVFASGSHKIEEVMALTPEATAVMDYALRFAEAFDLTHTALDIVRDKSGRLLLLENTTIWGRPQPGRIYRSQSLYFAHTDKGWEPTQYTMGTHFELLAEMIMEGCF
jgi:glutathione synthase/RimK-type ligase-like ATP-grasp enzyme